MQPLQAHVGHAGYADALIDEQGCIRHSDVTALS
ncbi:uncharacterized protein SOCE836_079980 [Sorangium cellulosum]|uniref:Uncharacterized protein n=1 Tax=Sorangium cellulosum TaxID=56 RepID=A0A4P2QYY6_SORCE|nr:uncharacterized protein SOCE836_079980 [Sorangium cellulosum]WCQ95096.1 hypothetical protein NQZ70_07871 [Sorangium sp. Soce836]